VVPDQPADSGGDSREGPAKLSGGSNAAAFKHDGTLGLSRIVRSKVGNWVTILGIAIPVLLVAVFVFLWFIKRDRIPKTVLLATATHGSSYYVFGTTFCNALNSQLGSDRVQVVETTGSGKNVHLLQQRAAQLGMYQGGTVDLHDVVVLAPLYREVVHVLVKEHTLQDATHEGCGPNGECLRDLLIAEKREVYAGPADSGMRSSACEILEHYGIDAQQVHFAEKESQTTDVVISTTGVFSKAMQNRLKRGTYLYLPIDADAIANRHAHFTPHRIHRASYRNEKGEPVPSQDIPTVATIAFLVTRDDTSPRLVTAALDALYRTDLGRERPELIPRDQARAYLHGMAVHKTAGAFFDPYDIAYLISLVESMAATKELFVALCASVYLLWTLRRRRREKLRKAQVEANRIRLGRFVDRTVSIESMQIGITDPTQLTQYLDEVTRIKLEALDELTDAELRGDRSFSIFLMQCANLIQNLQLKMLAHTTDLEKVDDS
jgi:TRAP-type uncharacterized transport system substrate-binding protein